MALVEAWKRRKRWGNNLALDAVPSEVKAWLRWLPVGGDLKDGKSKEPRWEQNVH